MDEKNQFKKHCHLAGRAGNYMKQWWGKNWTGEADLSQNKKTYDGDGDDDEDGDDEDEVMMADNYADADDDEQGGREELCWRVQEPGLL